MSLRDGAFGAALAWDVLVGEPPVGVHPVVLLGKVVHALERFAPEGPRARRAYGVSLACGVPLAAAATGAWADRVGRASLAGFLLRAWLWKGAFALGALGEASRAMGDALSEGGARAGRAVLPHLCSRDPADLDEAELVGAAVASLGENASDSFVAPVMYGGWLGLPGALAYRAVNTLDAMIGYRTARYAELGWASARLDDLLNLVPARATAAALLLAGACHGGDAAGGLRVLRRDARAPESPNGGYPMAAMAGLLGIALEKRGAYHLGATGRRPRPADLARAWQLVVAACGIALGVLWLVEGTHAR